MKKTYLLSLLIGFTALSGCHKDIPLLGQNDNGQTVITPKSEVFIRSITLSSFPVNNPNTGLPWDENASQPFDLQDSIGPDIYYYIYYYNPDNQLTPLSYKQVSHFSDVLPLNPDSPLVYTLTEPFQIPPGYIDTTFYLTIYDAGLANPLTDSTYMDSIPFTIGPDTTQTNPYITSISGVGFNGSHVTVGLLWK